MRILSEERYEEIKKVINGTSSSTLSQLAIEAKTSKDTISRVWSTLNYEDYLNGIKGEKTEIEKMEEIPEAPLTEKLAQEFDNEVEKTKSIFQKFIELFKR